MHGHYRGFTREKESAQDSIAVLRRLLTYFAPYVGLLSIVGALLVLNAVFEVAGPYLVEVAIDQFIVPSGGSRPGWLAMLAPEGTPQTGGLARVMFILLGTYVLRWTSPLDGGRDFVGALGMTATAEHVYVTEAGNYGQGGCHCVMQFTRTGTYLRHWGTKGQAPQQFITPLGVATDSLANVYVVDHHNFRIQKFSRDGTYLSSWGSRDPRDPFIDPHDITVDRRGDLFITDFGGDRGQVMHFSYDTSAVQRKSWSDVKRGFRVPHR